MGTLTEKLTAIGDAVRSRTGGTSPLTLEQMAQGVEGLYGLPFELGISLTGDFRHPMPVLINVESKTRNDSLKMNIITLRLSFLGTSIGQSRVSVPSNKVDSEGFVNASGRTPLNELSNMYARIRDFEGLYSWMEKDRSYLGYFDLDPYTTLVECAHCPGVPLNRLNWGILAIDGTVPSLVDISNGASVFYPAREAFITPGKFGNSACTYTNYTNGSRQFANDVNAGIALSSSFAKVGTCWSYPLGEVATGGLFVDLDGSLGIHVTTTASQDSVRTTNGNIHPTFGLDAWTPGDHPYSYNNSSRYRVHGIAGGLSGQVPGDRGDLNTVDYYDPDTYCDISLAMASRSRLDEPGNIAYGGTWTGFGYSNVRTLFGEGFHDPDSVSGVAYRFATNIPPYRYLELDSNAGFQQLKDFGHVNLGSNSANDFAIVFSYMRGLRTVWAGPGRNVRIWPVTGWGTDWEPLTVDSPFVRVLPNM